MAIKAETAALPSSSLLSVSNDNEKENKDSKDSDEYKQKAFYTFFPRLGVKNKGLLCHHLYGEPDKEDPFSGADGFEKLCKHPDYYPYKASQKVISDNLDDFVNKIAPYPQQEIVLVTFGPGKESFEKKEVKIIQKLLENGHNVSNICAVDISQEFLKATAEVCRNNFGEDINMHLICSSFAESGAHINGCIKNSNVTVIGSCLGITTGNSVDIETDKAFLRNLIAVIGNTPANNRWGLIDYDATEDLQIRQAAYNNNVMEQWMLSQVKHLTEIAGIKGLERENFKFCYHQTTGSKSSGGSEFGGIEAKNSFWISQTTGDITVRRYVEAGEQFFLLKSDKRKLDLKTNTDEFGDLLRSSTPNNLEINLFPPYSASKSNVILQSFCVYPKNAL